MAKNGNNGRYGQKRNELSGIGGSGDGPGHTRRESANKKHDSTHTTGARRPHGETLGAGEKEGAGELRMAGNIYANPQSRGTNPKPAGGKFEGGANSYSPKGMRVEKEGE
jgi:hypothetical protein